MRQSPSVSHLNAGSALSGENIKVVVRIRPKLERECDQSASPFRLIANNALQVITKGDVKRYTFDYIANEESTQSEMFEETARSICDSVLEGYNGTVFVYGQTCSGKTYTILGSSYSSLPREVTSDTSFSALSSGSLTHSTAALTNKDDNRGILPRVIEYLFMQAASKYNQSAVSFSCSFLEIHQEQLADLLDPHLNKQLAIQTTNGSVSVDNLSKLSIKSVEEGYSLIIKGNKLRHIAPTGMNKESSRSHAVFSIYIERKVSSSGINGTTPAKARQSTRKSVFHIIDLAGSERQKGTEATGERLKEAGMINKSLMQLSFVIKSLSDTSNRAPHIHYRDSKLTMLLKDSIGGNSKTCIIANVSPSYQNISESISTLCFAKRAKKIKNKAIINEVKSIESVSKLQIEKMLEKYNTIKAENFYLLSLLKKNSTVAASQVQLKRASESQKDFAMTLDSIEEEIEEMLKEIATKEQHVASMSSQRDILKDQLQKLELDYAIREKEIKETEEKTKAINQAHEEMKKQIGDYTEDNSELLRKIALEQSDKNQKSIKYNEELFSVKRAIDNQQQLIAAKDKEINTVIAKESETDKSIATCKRDIEEIQAKCSQAKLDITNKEHLINEEMISINRLHDDINQMKKVLSSKDNDLLLLNREINAIKEKGERLIGTYEEKIALIKQRAEEKDLQLKMAKDQKESMQLELSQLKTSTACLENAYLNSVETLKAITVEVNALKKKRQSVLNGVKRYETENEAVLKEITSLEEDQSSTTSKINLLTKSKLENSQLKEGLNELKKAYDLLLKNINSSTGNKDCLIALAQELVDCDAQLTSKRTIMHDAIERIKKALPAQLKGKCYEIDNSTAKVEEKLHRYFELLYGYDEALDKSIRHLKEDFNEKKEKIVNMNKKLLIAEGDSEHNKENEFNEKWRTEIKPHRRTAPNANCIQSQAHLSLFNQFFGYKRKYEDFIPFPLYEPKKTKIEAMEEMGNTKKKPAPSALNSSQKHFQRIALGTRSQSKFLQRSKSRARNSPHHLNRTIEKLNTLTPAAKTKAKVFFPKTAHI